jgi:hypothetical protein
MARETKEQKELRRAAEEHSALLAKEAFRATMPARLMQLQANASSCGVNTRVSLTAAGPSVEFTRYEYDNKGSNFEEELSYDSEEWQVDYVERRLREFKEEIDARAARRALAEEAWKGLPLKERAAIKEFITNLM